MLQSAPLVFPGHASDSSWSLPASDMLEQIKSVVKERTLGVFDQFSLGPELGLESRASTSCQ